MPGQSFMKHGPMIAPRPPLAAYREDLARRGPDAGPFGPSDATWLAVGTILTHAVEAPPNSRPPLLPTLRDVVGSDPALRDVLTVSDRESPHQLELDRVSRIVRAIVERIEDEGALNLAYCMLSVLVDADVRLSVLERGRVLAPLGRVAWKTGALETAREQYRRAEVLGRAARIPELRIRAWVGYSIVARLRGNYPEVRKWGARAAHEADRAGLVELSAMAYHSLMVSSAVGGDLNAALVYGWRVFQAAIGNAAKEAGALLNLSQYLLECGEHEIALRGFTAALNRRPPARVALPALGGLAVAAAAIGDRDLVLATKVRIERLAAIAPIPYQCAGALFELTQALSIIGDVDAAAACWTRTLALAERHAFHEIVHRLELLRTAPIAHRAGATHMLDPKGTAVARAVASLELAGNVTGADL